MDDDGIYYWIERLPGERGQMHADLVLDGRVSTSWRAGSPAPLSTVEAALEHIRPASKEAS